ncbi:hypothetical protein AUQ37_09010 [Candidatus Methanomethylophilus sp. 1R26]|nr:hypothetical protein AUQ37_09010 [Candidatus Methanomethylophilus sp. 1R26]
MQTTIEGAEADVRLMPSKTTRTYRWSRTSYGQTASTANLIDQLALLMGMTKSEAVSCSIRLAALLVDLLGPEILTAASQVDPAQFKILVEMVINGKSCDLREGIDGKTG